MRPGGIDGVGRGLGLQVSQLDLSNIDLGKPSGRKLRRDYKWTLILLTKLSLPVLLSIVRGPSGLECGRGGLKTSCMTTGRGWQASTAGLVTVAGGVEKSSRSCSAYAASSRFESKLW